MAIYQSRPTQISAQLFTGENWDEMKLYAGKNFEAVDEEDRGDDPDIIAQVWDKLHSTWVGVKANQYIICGTKSEFYPCDPEVFEQKYKEIK